jgi:hypothetical protein
MKRGMRGTLVCALMAALTACGGGSDNHLSTAARNGLQPLVQQVRRAADSHDRQSVQHALAELQQAVGLYEKHGDISTIRAAQILTADASVQNQLALIPTATTTTTTTPTTMTTTTVPGDEHGHGDRHQGGGNGNND